jgi:fluoroquinolone resistance protein
MKVIQAFIFFNSTSPETLQTKKTYKPLDKHYLQVIEKTDFTATNLPQHDFESVEFRGCTFNNLSGYHFSDCLFTSCNLSNAELRGSKMQDVLFRDCKLIGINFFTTSDFGFNLTFERCQLDYASFEHKKMNKSVFEDCRLHGANFTQTDLSKSKMENCDLLNAIFASTNISGVDFSTNVNFNIDPTQNQVKKAKFAADNLAGLLSRFDLIIKP